jgi:hypothetical protein
MDRRQSPRFTTAAKVRVQLRAGDSFRLSCPVNASPGGMLIMLPDRLKTGRLLHLKLELPTGERLDVDAEVRHVRRDDEGRNPNFHTGIAFVGLSEFAERLLERHFALIAQPDSVPAAY